MAVVALPLIFMVLLIGTVDGRILRLNSSEKELISNGISGEEAFVTEGCRHQYGFLPCADNAVGYVFMIVVYQVLLIIGDNLIGSGSEVLFYITGPEFGGILFRILRALPSMMFMILTGIFSDKENAQSQVSVVVGVYAGITVFSLTVRWFMCMVSASKSLKEDSSERSESNWFSSKGKLRILIDNGVTVDDETCKTAGIMLLSLIPYLVLQLVYVFRTSSGKRFMTLIALVVSSLSLILYFAYQIRNPWMQKRSLNYSKLEKADDDDKCITIEELKNLMSQFEFGETDIDQRKAMEKDVSIFDDHSDKIITEQEFIQGFTNWISEANRSPSDTHFNREQMFNKETQLLQKKNVNHSSDIDKIMSKILKQAEGHLMRSESLITQDWKPNLERIQSLFREFDSNGNGVLTANELKQLIGRVKFGTYKMKDDDVIKEMFRVFDQDGNEVIDKEEFITGMKDYIEKAIKSVQTLERSKIIEEFDKIVWQVHGKRAFFKSVFQVLLGIAMLTFLAGPLMSNILDLSNAMNFPSFIISFVVVPLTMNSRAAIAALLPASKRRDYTASLTFSEMYGGVIMNNIAGLTTLLAIVYAKDLTCDFSAEVLTILVVCGIIGVESFLSTTYRLWTCIPAILLYPVSLGLFYFVQVYLNWN